MTPTLRKIAAAGLFLVAAFMALGFSVSTKEQSTGVTVFALLLTVGLPISVGIGLLRGAPRVNSARMQQLRDQTIDAEILRLAIERQGRLTAVELMSTLGLAEADVNASLDRMMKREVAEMDVTEEGVLVYTFHEARYMKGATEGKKLHATGGPEARTLHVDGGTEAKRLRDG